MKNPTWSLSSLLLNINNFYLYSSINVELNLIMRPITVCCMGWTTNKTIRSILTEDLQPFFISPINHFIHYKHIKPPKQYIKHFSFQSRRSRCSFSFGVILVETVCKVHYNVTGCHVTKSAFVISQLTIKKKKGTEFIKDWIIHSAVFTSVNCKHVCISELI